MQPVRGASTASGRAQPDKCRCRSVAVRRRAQPQRGSHEYAVSGVQCWVHSATPCSSASRVSAVALNADAAAAWRRVTQSRQCVRRGGAAAIAIRSGDPRAAARLGAHHTVGCPTAPRTAVHAWAELRDSQSHPIPSHPFPAPQPPSYLPHFNTLRILHVSVFSAATPPGLHSSACDPSRTRCACRRPL